MYHNQSPQGKHKLYIIINSNYVFTNCFRYPGVIKMFTHNVCIAIWRPFWKIPNIGSHFDKISDALEKN